jgi:hypothetical protein
MTMKYFLFAFCLLMMCFTKSWAQEGSVDSLLPPDHILEDVPWLDDGGKVEQKGLFSFEDIRAVDSKDLLLIYRSSDSSEDLTQPHSQTLVVCFYNPTQKKYEKAYSEEGQQIQWVKVVADVSLKKSFIFVDRLNTDGQQVLKAYACLNNIIQPVLEAQTNHVYVGFLNDAKGFSVLCSDKAIPQNETDAEHLFKWNDGKSLFVEASATPAGGWTGSSIAGAGTVVAVVTPIASTPLPVAASVSSASTTLTPVVAILTPVPAVISTGSKDWWGTSFDAASASAKLDNEIVPQAVKAGQMAVLGKKANRFFQKAREQGVGAAALTQMRAGYYSAVASTLSGMNQDKDAAYYLDLALKLDPTNAQAMDLKAKLKP